LYENKRVDGKVITRYVGKSSPTKSKFSVFNSLVLLLIFIGVAGAMYYLLQPVDVSPTGDLIPVHWWTPAEIRRAWPDLFDATSGHLPMPLMVAFAIALKDELGELPPADVYQVPTGSGETITALRWAYSNKEFQPLYGESVATAFEKKAPLNMVVAPPCEK